MPSVASPLVDPDGSATSSPSVTESAEISNSGMTRSGKADYPVLQRRYRGPMQVTDIDPAQFGALGELTVRAYRALPGRPPSPEYEALLRDVATRAAADRVLV